MTQENASAGAQPEANGELKLPTSMQKNPSFIVSRLSGTCCMLLTLGINLNPQEGVGHMPPRCFASGMRAPLSLTP